MGPPERPVPQRKLYCQQFDLIRWFLAKLPNVCTLKNIVIKKVIMNYGQQIEIRMQKLLRELDKVAQASEFEDEDLYHFIRYGVTRI